MTAYFQRNVVPAKVLLADGEMRLAGYHLVLWNRGPAQARQVGLRAYDASGEVLDLLDIAPDEFPLDALDAGARYPIPWAIADIKVQNRRRFSCTLEWTDPRGFRTTTLPLRRGQVS
jgi:hypothetical protein